MTNSKITTRDVNFFLILYYFENNSEMRVMTDYQSIRQDTKITPKAHCLSRLSVGSPDKDRTFFSSGSVDTIRIMWK